MFSHCRAAVWLGCDEWIGCDRELKAMLKMAFDCCYDSRQAIGLPYSQQKPNGGCILKNTTYEKII
ncbi:hypothetical protein REMIM1_CH02639 [Rhizobium etli bv. mimosae str. Mim1]|nr:hypothetical protein REMIM1_CH02639 [Rhizobium etli bv. mimosae str. Mim1]